MVKEKEGRLHNGKYWWIIGGLFYLGTAISSIIRSLNGYGFYDNLFMSLDWFSACIIYFFIGGIVGHLVDYGFARYNGRKVETPFWFWATIAIWIIGSVIAGFMSKTGEIWPGLIAIFPLAYGIFFAGAGYVALLQNVLKDLVNYKIYYDLFLLAVFGSWLYLSITGKNKMIRNLLLGLLMIVFAVGCIWTARFLVS